MRSVQTPTRLLLADGTVFAGRSFGAACEAAGEVVFHTGLVGYVEALTDPSYRGQILVLTYPLQGNYGVPAGNFESERIQVAGLVVANYTAVPSHHASVQSLGDWLSASAVPAITGVDTRALTKRLRQPGTMHGGLLSDQTEQLDSVNSVDLTKVIELVQPAEIREYAAAGPRILLIDTGAKESIATALNRRGAHVLRVPARAAWEESLPKVDGVVLGNGPGDPKDVPLLIARLRRAFVTGESRLPVFGICLGHQLLALAAGADTYKLPFGHRSHNQPVLKVDTQRAFVTSQNHGYAVDGGTLPPALVPWFSNLNDGTNEGLRHRELPIRSVQFHPEAAGGPRDTAFLFDDFLAAVDSRRSRS